MYLSITLNETGYLNIYIYIYINLSGRLSETRKKCIYVFAHPFDYYNVQRSRQPFLWSKKSGSCQTLDANSKSIYLLRT